MMATRLRNAWLRLVWQWRLQCMHKRSRTHADVPGLAMAPLWR